MNDLCFTPAVDLARDIRHRRLSPAEAADAVLRRIENENPAINALVYQRDAEAVLQSARAAEDTVMRGAPLGQLHGVPFTVKDTTPVQGVPNTYGMAPFRSNVATHTAPAVARLERAGGIFIGVTNTPEMAYCGITDNHLYGPTRNPWDTGKTAGGSSGGAAAAVAAGLGPLAEGSDAAGSVRVPASCCGVYGLKPSAGRIPNVFQGSGSFGIGTSEGPITRTVADAATMLQVMAGPDERDPLSLPAPGVDYLTEIDKDVKGWRVAWTPDLGFGDTSPEVHRITSHAVHAFADLGCEVEQAHPDLGDAVDAFWHTTLQRLGMIEHLFGDWSKWRGSVSEQYLQLLEEAKGVSMADISRAESARIRMWGNLCTFFDEYDLLVTPTVGTEPFPVGQFTPDHLIGRPLKDQLLGWFLTYPFNFLGVVPAASIPAGFTADGLPVGLQIIGGRHADAAVLRASANFERARPWSSLQPT